MESVHWKTGKLPISVTEVLDFLICKPAFPVTSGRCQWEPHALEFRKCYTKLNVKSIRGAVGSSRVDTDSAMFGVDLRVEANLCDFGRSWESHL